ncbi:hypothetical protein J4H86_12955 [Spiractinospora alimapuensis]|uniref:hypothetical protein n=1 Tax=Spiractinospora alimapuensis TaxID=2820884 RepID=UPI001F2EF7AF|nr:hypothetical protein [Spiractinospora alimapuensis]QVQ54489.1 hypothetical protein J4H86_12955 [Spiractinospora alimapuensis]
MAKFAKFQLTVGPADARTVLENALSEQGYRMSWENEYRGLAEKGSKTKAMLLGALAMHFKYNLQIDQAPDGSIVASVFLGNTGMSGGAIGLAKVRTELDRLYTVVRQAYESKGILRGAEFG